MTEITPQQITLLIILAIAFILLLTEKLRVDLTAMLIIVALTATRLIDVETALSGFASEPAIIAAAVFVLSGGLYVTGLSDKLGDLIGRYASGGYTRTIAVMMPAVALLSAFTHHLTITAVMLPVTLKLSRDQDIPASKLLIPMSLAASLGTTLLIISAPAFLIANRILQQSGQPSLQIYSIAPIGIALCILGTVYMLVFGRFLLPDRKEEASDDELLKLSGYYTELVIPAESKYIDMPFSEFEASHTDYFRVAGFIRADEGRLSVRNDATIQAGDVLLVRTSPEELATVKHDPDLAIHALQQYGERTDRNLANDEGEESNEQAWHQAIVAPDSPLVNRTIGRLDFLNRYGLIVLAIWRQRSWLRAELANVKLKAGDVLVIQGNELTLAELKKNRSFLMLLPFSGEPRLRHRAWLAGLIMLGGIVAAVTQIVPIEIAMLGSATLMVLTNCLTIEQAYNSIETRIYLFIAGVIPLGLAMEETGTAALLADWMESLIGGLPVSLALFILFASSALITQMMSDAGTTALLAPIAVALARLLNQPPEPFVMAIAMAAVASFLTPIGHHGNLLIYGPGRYEFMDFVKVGLPLTILIGIVVVVLSQLMWAGG